MYRSTLARLILPSARYQQRVSSGEIKSCPHQESALRHVDRLYNDLIDFKSSAKGKIPRDVSGTVPKRGSLNPLLNVAKKAAGTAKVASGDVFHPLSQLRSVYMHGGVGCGKTMLMDLLYEEVPYEKKQRVHFHQFMNDVHKTMHSVRSERLHQKVDPIEQVAARLIGDVELLCFDEMVVADIADAMILRRLFASFYKIGVCCVFTSNRAPNELYKNGLNRESFVPFIRLIEDKCDIHNMNSKTDYRLTGNPTDSFMSPINSENQRKFENMFLEFSKMMQTKPKVLRVYGRDVVIPKAVAGVARITFAEMCNTELSAADYEVIAKSFHTIFLEDIPQFPPHDSDTKRRFIALIDVLYQYKVKVIALCEVDVFELEKNPEQIEGYDAAARQQAIEAGSIGSSLMDFGQIIDAGEHVFQMQRTTSRLLEMRTTEYLRQTHQGEEVGLDTM